MVANKVAASGPNGESYVWDEVTNAWVLSNGIIVKSPNGTKWKIIVSNLGTVGTEQVV